MAQRKAGQNFLYALLRNGVHKTLSRNVGDSCRALSTSVPPASSALLDHIKTKILMRGGPLSIAEYMQDCLTSPQGGFYMHRDVFGSSGDFVTSPEISQLFGEMVGIWCVHTWMSLGRPPRLQLVEMGPGRGTLMADLLRATAAFRDFSSSLEVHLVEISPALRNLQWRALQCSNATAEIATAAAAGNSSNNNGDSSSSSSTSRHSRAEHEKEEELRYLRSGMTPIVGHQSSSSASSSGQGGAGSVAAAAGGATSRPEPQQGICGFNGAKVTWHASLDAVPDGPAPALYIAHEFFDALPVHQFVRDPKRGWLEKMVDVQAEQQDGGGSDLDPDPNPNPNRDPGCQAASGDGSAGMPEARGDSGSLPASRTSGSGLRLVLSPGPTPAAALLVPRRLAGLRGEQVEEVEALEISAVGLATAERLAQRIGRNGGAALVVDYGREAPPYGDSLMAIRGHRGVGILDAPGSADLSAWVDFGALKLVATTAAAAAAATTAAAAVTGAAAAAAAAAAAPGPAAAPAAAVAETPVRPVRTSGPVSQAAFLRALGIETRLQWLAGRTADPEAAAALAAGCARLVGGSEEGGMGVSYQVMAIHQDDLREMAGF
ncbi:hypothetical protein PLESTF_000956200 [Pleodorina starrii]|nr:hypothetical protein PLESTM_001885500 [Pleodorina starrii]GLC70295.1 hypothetical protein PLESTF_000956200 [Pleodorina starrii]